MPKAWAITHLFYQPTYFPKVMWKMYDRGVICCNWKEMYTPFKNKNDTYASWNYKNEETTF
eukprot:1244702-Ditylum_brightwellii.AAC.1